MNIYFSLATANSWWMYLLGAIVTLFVLVGSGYFIYKSYKDAEAIGMDKQILKKVIFNSAIFTILPSISILIGIVALSGSIGVPLPWIRLSVIGALHYEGGAVSAVQEAFKDLYNITEMTNQSFVTIAFVMTIGILSGPIYCLFGFKAYDKKVLYKTREEKNEVLKTETTEEKPKKKNFGDVLFNAVFIAMICAFLSVDMVKIFDTNKIGTTNEDGVLYTPTNTFIPLIVIAITFLSMFIFDILEKKCKQKWLSSFSLGLSMVIGMASAVLINFLFNLG